MLKCDENTHSEMLIKIFIVIAFSHRIDLTVMFAERFWHAQT